MIYVVPNFQNPSGRTWTLQRRASLMALAEARGLAVIEDNPYGEVRFEGEHLPSLRTFDRSDIVIGLGTLSKIFCPGLRLGWITAARPITEKLSLVKQGADLHSPTLNQLLAVRYLERVDFQARIRDIIDLYRPRRDAMADSLAKLLPGVRFTRPEGGLFLWVTLPEEVDARALLQTSLARGVAFVPGEGFFPNGGRRHHLRLNFSYTSEERIREGIGRIAAALAEHIALVAPPRHTSS
jgi:DNA-binding transcriptional MocR family regulator